MAALPRLLPPPHSWLWIDMVRIVSNLCGNPLPWDGIQQWHIPRRHGPIFLEVNIFQGLIFFRGEYFSEVNIFRGEYFQQLHILRCCGRTARTKVDQRPYGKLQQTGETGDVSLWSFPIYLILPHQVANESDAIVLKFGLTLQQIMDVVSTSPF